MLDVNTNTVLRALRLLRDQGLLEFCGGRGISVAGTPERTAVLSKAREPVDVRISPRLQRRELVTMIEHVTCRGVLSLSPSLASNAAALPSCSPGIATSRAASLLDE